MAKIDLYDPKWVEMVFAGKNKEYGAYQLRKGTSGRNIKALLILVIAAALVGGFLAWKVIEQKQAEEQQAYMEAMELAKLQQQAKKEEKKKEPVKPKVEMKKEIPVARETQKFTAPVIKKDELVKEENQVKQMDKLDDKVAVGTENKEGVKDRTVEAVRNDIAVAAPPPPPAPNLRLLLSLRRRRGDAFIPWWTRRPDVLSCKQHQVSCRCTGEWCTGPCYRIIRGRT